MGCWNIYAWNQKKTREISAMGLDICGIQETHLARLPLEGAKRTCRQEGSKLYHGEASKEVPGSIHGRTCGVGFLAGNGVSLSSPSFHSSPAYNRLYGMGRVHSALIKPTQGLPHGLLLVYAPVQRNGEKEAF
mgnify:CR=1 FL=1